MVALVQRVLSALIIEDFLQEAIIFLCDGQQDSSIQCSRRILLMILSRLAVTLRTQTTTIPQVNGSSKSQNMYHDFKKNWGNVTL